MGNPVQDGVHKGLNTATMLAFAIPEVGPIVGGALTGAGALFDVVLDFPVNTDPLARVPTEGDLQQAVLDIKAIVDNALITHDLQDMFDKFQLYAKTLHASWKDTNTTQGITFVGSFRDAATEAAWIADRSNALQGPLRPQLNGDQPPMLERLHRIMNQPTLRLQTVGMYIYAVNIFIMFCKINMIWEYVVALRAHDIAQDLNDAATLAAAKAAMIWAKADKATRGPAPTLPAKLTAMIDLTTFEAASQYIVTMKTELGGPDAWTQAAIKGKSKPDLDANGDLPDDQGSFLLLQYLMDIHTEVTDAYTAAETLVGQRDAQITVIQTNGAYQFHDAANGYTSPLSGTQAQAQQGRDLYSGQIEEGIMDQMITQKHYDLYDQQTLDDIKSIIDAWTQGLLHADTFLTNYGDVKVPPIFDLGT